MNKILIVFRPTSQVHLVSRLRKQMLERGINVEAFNTVTWDYIDSDAQLPTSYKMFKEVFRISIIGKVLRKIINTRLLCEISKDYDYVDIHFFSRDYISFLLKLKKPYKITIWGSDFYRATDQDAERKRPCYRNSKLIQVETSSVKRDFLKYEPNLADKIRICNFGIDIIDKIDELDGLNNKKIENEKIVLTCGYNGTEGQQHLLMIDAVNKLPKTYRQKIKMQIPATYGLSSGYKERLQKALAEVDFDHTIIDRRLSEMELAELRLRSDIVLNIQITDTLSSSLLQHLYAGGILIVGDWLPYEIYDENGLFYISTSIPELPENIKKCIDNMNIYKSKCIENRAKVKSFASWEAVSNKQYHIYRDLLGE